MRRILITGANSYIGTSFEKWMTQWPEEYQVDSVGTRNDEWKGLDFSPYDTIFHVAGIAHIKETRNNRKLYYEINRDLAISVAKKAQRNKVKQFIFLSSMSVYGLNVGNITEYIKENPKSAYGKSKYEAEIELIKMENESKGFNVAILRPPMVYGKNCRGNYQSLAKYAKTFPVFPNFENKRSMIFIDHLSEFVKIIIDKNESGIFFPQNKEYITTSNMVQQISASNGKKILLTRIFNSVLKKMMSIDKFKKVFGDLTYDVRLSDYLHDYNIYDFNETISHTEK